MKILALILVLIAIYYYYVTPTNAGPIGDGHPSKLINGWRYWKDYSWDGEPVSKNITSQDRCFSQADESDAAIGSATYNNGECTLWKTTSSKQIFRRGDTTWSRAFKRLPWSDKTSRLLLI